MVLASRNASPPLVGASAPSPVKSCTSVKAEVPFLRVKLTLSGSMPSAM